MKITTAIITSPPASPLLRLQGNKGGKINVHADVTEPLATAASVAAAAL